MKMCLRYYIIIININLKLQQYFHFISILDFLFNLFFRWKEFG